MLNSMKKLIPLVALISILSSCATIDDLSSNHSLDNIELIGAREVANLAEQVVVVCDSLETLSRGATPYGQYQISLVSESQVKEVTLPLTKSGDEIRNSFLLQCANDKGILTKQERAYISNMSEEQLTSLAISMNFLAEYTILLQQIGDQQIVSNVYVDCLLDALGIMI